MQTLISWFSSLNVIVVNDIWDFLVVYNIIMALVGIYLNFRVFLMVKEPYRWAKFTNCFVLAILLLVYLSLFLSQPISQYSIRLIFALILTNHAVQSLIGFTRYGGRNEDKELQGSKDG